MDRVWVWVQTSNLAHSNTSNVVDHIALFDTRDECNLVDSSKEGRIYTLKGTMDCTGAFHVIAILFQTFDTFLDDLLSVPPFVSSSLLSAPLYICIFVDAQGAPSTLEI